jgi:hypothetical protein
VGRAGEGVAPIDVGLHRRDGTLGGQGAEKRRADRALHVEARQRFVSTRLRHRRLRTGDRRLPEAKIDRLPREQRTGRATPDTLR